MRDFADVQQFARQHTTCGGLTPKATSSSEGGGYQLTITCACGAIHDRWVTPDEASRPLPRPSPLPVPPPAPRPFRSWPARPTPAPQPVAVAVGSARPSHGRVVWVVLILLLGTAAAVYGIDRFASRRATLPPAAMSSASPGDVVRALRELQTTVKPTATLNDYASRVAAARAKIERLVAAGSPLVRTQAHDVLEIHRLAVTAWRARMVNDGEEWARIGRDPAVELCPSVKRAVDAAGPVSRAVSRGAAVATALPQLWECAAAKIAALDRRSPGG
jgi:hypothetical protein